VLLRQRYVDTATLRSSLYNWKPFECLERDVTLTLPALHRESGTRLAVIKRVGIVDY